MKQWLRIVLMSVIFGVASRSASAAPFELQFLDAMVPHHQMAVEMAQIAVKKARHPELKQLARRILADQQREIAQMRALRKSWYGLLKTTPDMSGAMNHDMMDHGAMMSNNANMGDMGGGSTMMGLRLQMKMDMNTLSRARDFDRAFLEMMIPHHASAIVMAQEVLDRPARPQLRRLSRQIIDSQAEEIGLMNSWLRRWRGKA